MTPHLPPVRPAVPWTACTVFGLAILGGACSSRPSTPAPAQAAASAPAQIHVPTPEEKLRAEVATWKAAPYVDGGTSRTGVDQPAFVAAVFKDVFGGVIPATQEEQIRTGKLVERGALSPGDLVFLDGKGFGVFRPHLVAIYVGHDEIALAQKVVGVSIVKVTDPQWTS